MRTQNFFAISGVDVDASTLTNNATTYTDALSLKQGNEINHYVNIHLIGASFGSSSLSIQPQQSDDGTDWVSVPDVAAIALNSTTTSESVQFTTAAPYIRLAITKTGTDALTLIAKALASKDISTIAVTVALNSSEVTSSVEELNTLDITSAGTVQASKAVVVDSNKDIGDFRNLDAVNIDAGASGTAGSVDIFPSTGSKGKLAITCTDQTGNTTVSLVADAMAAARTIHIPDPGKDAYVVTSSALLLPAEVDVLQDVTAGTQAAGKAVIADANVNTGVSKVTQLHIGASGSEVQVNATAAEINNICDVSAFSQTLTSSGAITAGKSEVLLDHTSVAIAATIASTANHRGGLLVKAITEPGGGQDHTVTITTGTWNGTNKIATFADINDAIYVIFDSAGNGSVIGNVGSVAFSG